MLSRSIKRILPLNRRFLCHHRALDVETQINELNLKMQKLEDEKVSKMDLSNIKIKLQDEINLSKADLNSFKLELVKNDMMQNYGVIIGFVIGLIPSICYVIIIK